MWSGAGRTAIVGWGLSEITRTDPRPLGELALEACAAALADANLSAADLDGLATYPDQPFHGAARVDGVDLVSVGYLLDHLPGARRVEWYAQVSEGMVASAVVEAVNALLAGVCRHVLVWRAMRRPPGTYGAWTETRVGGDAQFTAPYGFTSIVATHAVAYQRYLARYGASREAMADLAVTQRQGARLNPHAIFRDRELTREQYLDARMIADPLCLYDCDVPVQGCAALVLSTTERARDLVERPAQVLAYAQQTVRRAPVPAPLYMLDDHVAAGRSTTDALWSRAGLGPGEIDVAQLYDGFSPSVYYWLEAAGFCAEGEASRFVADGGTSRSGSLPVNTFGGSLSEGRLHGMGHLIEAARQVSGRAGPRQVVGAETALALDGSPLLRNAGLVLGADGDRR
jgi:acetyl-CoA acetyltransferase